MIKFALTTILAILAPLGLFAEETCYEFDVAKFSQNVPKLEVRLVDKAPKDKTSGTAIVTASSGKTQNTKTSYVCKKNDATWSCNQAAGAGDFKLETESKVKMNLTYLNLAIGSTGSFSFKDDDEVTEEFAIYDRSIDANGDEETDDDSGELTDFEMIGKSVPCADAAKK